MIRLINTTTFEVEEFEQLPRFGVVSFTWIKDDPIDIGDTIIKCKWYDKCKGFSNERLTCIVQQCSIHVSYLWMDVFCINQFDELDKAEQLPKMSDIYEQASLTFVFFESFDKSKQLYDKCFEWKAAYDVNDILNEGFGHLKRLLDLSADIENFAFEHRFYDDNWWRRVWTLEECVLSSNLVIVIDQNIYDLQTIMDTLANPLRELFPENPPLDDLETFYSQDLIKRNVKRAWRVRTEGIRSVCGVLSLSMCRMATMEQDLVYSVFGIMKHFYPVLNKLTRIYTMSIQDIVNHLLFVNIQQDISWLQFTTHHRAYKNDIIPNPRTLPRFDQMVTPKQIRIDREHVHVTGVVLQIIQWANVVPEVTKSDDHVTISFKFEPQPKFINREDYNKFADAFRVKFSEPEKNKNLDIEEQPENYDILTSFFRMKTEQPKIVRYGNGTWDLVDSLIDDSCKAFQIAPAYSRMPMPVLIVKDDRCIGNGMQIPYNDNNETEISFYSRLCELA
ncbi:hypothetical protein Unana1_03713 [Umbelopsis nana]